MPPKTLVTYVLSEEDNEAFDAVIDDILRAGHDPRTGDLYDLAWRYLAGVPAGLREALSGFRNGETGSAFAIRGLRMDPDAIEPTPASWADADSLRREEIFLALTGMCLGEVFGWSTIQNGSLIQNVLPLPGVEQEQSGHSSDVLLGWHTEDAFHPYRCDYVGLLGIRNLDRIPTTVASIRDIELSEEAKRILSERRYVIYPDTEHLGQTPDDGTHFGLSEIQKLRDDPEPVAVLFGHPDEPYLRLDPFYMKTFDTDPEAEVALKEICEKLMISEYDVVLEPGDIVYVDNFTAVHGRRPFRAKYDGRDRWLKKLTVTRNLRASRGLRRSSSSRVIG
ncbi:guanitoxin biosynthesis L-enduracididine beta-hydroxylase GntD [Streptomyces sp. NPDC058646]|uniref:guanitoxin biosynthesis L-enduracididine beta-hydroxylase GntD n=1 Tax=Streptomyces sp. NPDC058646 TaxID=3346574 RepID=UPI003662C836